MRIRNITIRKAVQSLNNQQAELGGFWLPNIQRPFVWSEEQITRLFDSIMREYPVSTLLIWSTKDNVKHRKFIDNYHSEIRLTDFHLPDNRNTKMMVLDGQQRLQGFFIGLVGSYEKKELYFNILSGAEAVAPEDVRFKFEFLKTASWPWIKFKDLVLSQQLPEDLVDELKSQVPNGENFSDDMRRVVTRNIGRIQREFCQKDNITFQELDGIENNSIYNIDDVVEIFIRANSGGTKLSKSDLLFSLLTSNWDEADGAIESLIEDLNQRRFNFNRDFVLKACLTMLHKGARYEVGKFRDGKTKEEIIEKWDELAGAIKAIRDFLASKTYIRSDKAMPSYQALIPLIYFRFHFPEKFSKNRDILDYLLRVLATGVFSGSPDTLIDKIVRKIQDSKDFVVRDIYDVIRESGRSLEITPDVILEQYYGSSSESKMIHLFFNLWYRDFDYSPSSEGMSPQIDHIFPQSLLKKVKDVNPESGKKNVLRYPANQRDQIANCMLLTAEENGANGKGAVPPDIWFDRSRFESDEEHQKYLEMHLIPNKPKLWQIENYDQFIKERKKLIEKKFSSMLLKRK
ncbi:GmrSD restriction endonuclease domain-containing protein [Rivihabitans pingtungensis]|uniref:GmrSD restriction endonuclease domain-containing protein n=1 Tax=Rivihabitans pingtungensis TaxID=1054498 RepID=UPI002352C551|nr:DUF262 domain-containing protein [Rivihabitans pingtungensis]MCK6436160.1 DUF262 domain-containing protein [Rivihabitans pingtungensis]